MCHYYATHIRFCGRQRQLIRKEDNDALFRTAAAGVGESCIV